MLPLPPVRYRDDRYELQPAAGGGEKYCLHCTLTFHSKVINSVKSLGKMCGIIKDNEDEEEY